MDQGSFATSNFMLNVLLARWLTPYEYGAFGLAFAVYLFVGNLHQATLLEPMLVFGPGRYRDRLPQYLGALVYGHFAFVAVGSAALMLGSLGLALQGLAILSWVMLVLALTGPFSLLLWLMRRACYIRLEPRLAAWGGVWYMVLMLAGAYVLYWKQWLSASSALVLMGVSSLAVSVWLVSRLGVRLPRFWSADIVGDSFRSHWEYGRWSLLNQGLNWFPLNLPYLLLPIWGGFAAGASFKALMNLIMPMMQGVWALSTLLLPALVRVRDGGKDAIKLQVRSALVVFVVGSIAYWLVLGLLHRPLVSWLYAGRYAEQSYLLWVLGLCPVFVAAKLVVGNSLRALERPDRLVWAHGLSAALAIAPGALLVYFGGVAGAGILLLICQLVAAVMTVVYYRRLLNSPEASRLGGVPSDGHETTKG